MKDQIQIGDLTGAHAIWRYVSIGAVIFGMLFVGLALVSPNPTACIAVAAVSFILAVSMLIPLRFVDHSLVLVPEGICWISKARRKCLPWHEVAGARVHAPSHSTDADHRPRLYIDCIDGSTNCETRLRFPNQETADAINEMKEMCGDSNK